MLTFGRLDFLLVLLFAVEILSFYPQPHSFALRLRFQYGYKSEKSPRLQQTKTSLSNLCYEIAPVLDSIPEKFDSFFRSVINATAIRGADTSNQGHDSFRYEWGTWVVDSSLEYLMEQVNRVRLVKGAYETLVAAATDGNDIDALPKPERFRIAGSTYWDCILHVLPPDSNWQGRWPTGSWTIVKVLTGVVQIASLSGPDRHGSFKTKTSRDLRGGSDGSLGSGQSTKGDDCIKYVGGPLRSYRGKYGKTVLLEVVVRAPTGMESMLADIEPLLDLQSIIEIVESEGVIEEAPVAEQNTKAAINAHLGSKLGMEFEKVGGLDKQLDAIVRRVLASRANPKAAKRLGVGHVRGILLSGPPGCGKTLLARELSRMLGAREPIIVNGPEILDKYIGEAEKKVRELFLPAEQEYKVLGDDSALHVIVLDEMDSIARKRGTMTADTTGVRDSVVNQLLAKMDGVREASNILVIGLTNRPDLLDPALLRPGRLEVQLRVELPDREGRRAILRIHTRQMKEAGGLGADAMKWIEDLSDMGLAAKSEYYSGAELAGLVRSAASFALSRAIEEDNNDAGAVTRKDFQESLQEVRPALGKQDELLKSRYPLGISACSASIQRVMRDLERFTRPTVFHAPRIQSLLLVGSGGQGGAGVTALAAWAAANASNNDLTDYVRFVTALDLITASEGGNDAARAAALVSKFEAAKEMPHSLIVFDDVDQLCAGSGQAGYSSVMIATIRALLRVPPTTMNAKAGGRVESKVIGGARTVRVIATTSRSDAACVVLHELFDETIVVPLLEHACEVASLLRDADGFSSKIVDCEDTARRIINKLDKVGIKTALRIAERVVAETRQETEDVGSTQSSALDLILNDLSSDGDSALQLCEVIA
ncbi:hypothetical protein MPSEU_001072800 [Mayamaea pseudoterrestris]|nr:hypothetical protein MPSEU_001072800 [Mayamaea pseudoterrestris]